MDSGNLFKHPVKRTRTTLAYLAVAASGDPKVRKAYRRAVGRSHAKVRSTPESPVEYNAFDPELQLWVAACLYKGWEDVQRILVTPTRSPNRPTSRRRHGHHPADATRDVAGDPRRLRRLLERHDRSARDRPGHPRSPHVDRSHGVRPPDRLAAVRVAFGDLHPRLLARASAPPWASR